MQIVGTNMPFLARPKRYIRTPRLHYCKETASYPWQYQEILDCFRHVAIKLFTHRISEPQPPSSSQHAPYLAISRRFA